MPDVIIFNAFGADFAGLAVALRGVEGSPIQTNESAAFAGVNDINALAQLCTNGYTLYTQRLIEF